MKICVLGAGVIGVSTAYALARLGHDVIVIDKGDDVASGASHANGAQLSYSYIDPLAGPSTLRKLPLYMLGFDPSVQLKFSFKKDYLLWGLSFLKNCSDRQFKLNRESRQVLAGASQEALSLLEKELPKGAFKKSGQGKIVLAQSQSEHETMRRSEHYLSPQNCMNKEPALKFWNGEIMGGLYTEDDYALDPQIYCKVLREACETDFGVEFVFGQSVKGVVIEKATVKAVETEQARYDVDNIIVCLGNAANQILAPLGLKLPIYSIQGYSITLVANSLSPRVSVTDLKNKTVYANLGKQVRIAGFVDANQRGTNIKERIEQLLLSAKNKWPQIADYDDVIERWSHARPMMPSGVPVIGATKINGLYLNVGHGSLGYTFAAGSAIKIANVIGHAQKNTSIFRGVNYAN